MAAPEMTSTKTWGEFFDPYCGGGGKWRPFRFRPPSWMTSFPGSGNEVIQDGGRKRKGRHFPPPPQWGSKNSPYTTIKARISSLVCPHIQDEIVGQVTRFTCVLNVLEPRNKRYSCFKSFSDVLFS